ncbi:MAG: hypothetical protein DA405_10740 [Bacteroidetes bacterium]|nr:MAG: hypothetical protein DA405_10740 [Bacteroidota bacterium]
MDFYRDFVPLGLLLLGKIYLEMDANHTNCYQSRRDETIIEKSNGSKTPTPKPETISGRVRYLSRCRTYGAFVLLPMDFYRDFVPLGLLLLGKIYLEMDANHTNCYQSRRDETIIEKSNGSKTPTPKG